MGFLRLITNAHVMGPDVLSQRNAGKVYDDLARDKRVTFAIESAEIEPLWKSYTQGRFTGTNVWTDPYLAALASCWPTWGLTETDAFIANVTATPSLPD